MDRSLSIRGGLLGLALGDALGAPYEGGPVERLLWRAIGKTRRGEMRWTDDTQMALDLAESLVAHGVLQPDDVARRFAASYSWTRGYGPGAARVLKRIRRGAGWEAASRSVFPDGSYGNGGAMRAPIVGLFHADRSQRVVEDAQRSARVTHAHPLALEGAALIACATAKATVGGDAIAILEAAAAPCELTPFLERLELTRTWLAQAHDPAPDEVRGRLGNGMAATDSCVTALHIALRFLAQPFEELVAFCVKCGGDVDTLASMAGAIWGAANGSQALPSGPLSRLEQRSRLEAAAAGLAELGAG